MISLTANWVVPVWFQFACYSNMSDVLKISCFKMVISSSKQLLTRFPFLILVSWSYTGTKGFTKPSIFIPRCLYSETQFFCKRLYSQGVYSFNWTWFKILDLFPQFVFLTKGTNYQFTLKLYFFICIYIHAFRMSSSLVYSIITLVHIYRNRNVNVLMYQASWSPLQHIFVYYLHLNSVIEL